MKNGNTFEGVFLDLHGRLLSSFFKTLDSINKSQNLKKKEKKKKTSPGFSSIRNRLMDTLKYYSMDWLFLSFQDVHHQNIKIVP